MFMGLRRNLRFTLTAVFLGTLMGCGGPSFIDKECIKGRISSEQAKKINQGPWEHLPTYNRDAQGKCKECAEERDRVFAAKCSEFIKEMTLQDL